MGRFTYRAEAESQVSILNQAPYHSDNPTNTGAHRDNTNRKRILIVEDNDLSLMLLNDFLVIHGYETLEAGHGLEAIKLTQDNKPDLILMDVQLPDLSGLDVTRILKQDDQTKGIPIIAVTAFAMPGDEAKALESGCDAHITKPVILDNLLRTVSSFLSPFSLTGGPSIINKSAKPPIRIEM